MSDLQPNDRSDGAYEIAGVIRREARISRRSQARCAQLLFDSYGWDSARIAEALDLTRDAVAHLLAADGVQRCVECSFGFHRSCMGELNFGVEGQLVPCECGCSSSALPTARSLP
ncbi:hypothetical protein [Microbacterium saperdae]|uniref:hypothetical protein n=1 Tax=Microbacterium saperdae TaxID=69368 RepID=UPI001151075F|nr:hypothetical protein [Microbacterium saperdae]GGM41945.1 hypothetical protein GCM10010489_11210 [Microbacterium saperdae]